MLDEDVLRRKKPSIFKGIVIGGISGGLLYIIFNALYRISVIDISLLGIIVSIVIGAIIGALYESYNPRSTVKEHISDTNMNSVSKQSILSNDEVKLKLREEQLDISKKQIQTGKVTVHKEVVTEERNIAVPITREELVIEKTYFDTENPNETENRTETIRIPISEEDIDISKHKVKLADVSVYNHQFEKIQQVSETLKKEKLNVKTTGKATVIDSETENTKNS